MITAAELKHLCQLTADLTRIRQSTVRHLSVENYAPALLSKLLNELKTHKTPTPKTK